MYLPKDFFESLYALNIFDYLQEFQSSEDRLKSLDVLAKKNADFAAIFVSTVKALRGQSEDAQLTLEDAIRLYGVHNTRGFFLAYNVSGFVKSKLLARDAKTGRLNTSPDKLLKYANKTLQFFGEDSRYKDVAYNLGLVYDLVSFYINRDGGKDASKLDEILDKGHKYACKVATKGIELGAKVNNLRLEKHIPTVTLLTEIGYVLNCIDSPAYFEAFKAILNTEHSVQARIWIDSKASSSTRSMIAASVASLFPLLEEATQSLYYLSTPFAIYESDPDAYALSSICLLAYLCSDSAETDATIKSNGVRASGRPELLEFGQ